MRGWRDLLVAIVLPAIAIAVVYLAPFAIERSTRPFGVDTSSYIWRTNVVHDLGVGSLSADTLGVASLARAANVPRPHGDRPAYPVITSLFRSATGLSSLTLTWLTPAILASALGLAAGSLAADGALERRRRSGTVVLAVGASAFVAWTAVGYAANLATDVVAVAAAVIALEVVRGRRGVIIGAVLLGAAVLLHWMFAFLLFAVLGAFALVQLVLPGEAEDGGRRRAGAAKLTIMLALGALLGFAALASAPERLVSAPSVGRDTPGKAAINSERITALALPATLPLAWLGSSVVALDPKRRRAAVLLAIWSSLAAVSVFAWYVLDLPLPPYRWAGFALAIPVAIVVGAFAVADRMQRRAARVVAVAVAIAAALALAAAGTSVWWSRNPVSPRTYEMKQLGTLSSYLRPLPPQTRIVFLLDPHPFDPRHLPPFNRVWEGLPAGRIAHLSLSTTIDRDRPDLGLDPHLLDGSTVVVALNAFLNAPLHAGRLLGSGVHLIAGPAPIEVRPGRATLAPPGGAMALEWLALLGVLLVAGAGWAALSDLQPLGVVAIAPAVGLAFLGYVGYAASRVGIPLRGPVGVGVICGIALAGWTAALLRIRRDRARIDRGV